jgi:hypothetical protein
MALPKNIAGHWGNIGRLSIYWVREPFTGCGSQRVHQKSQPNQVKKNATRLTFSGQARVQGLNTDSNVKTKNFLKG